MKKNLFTIATALCAILVMAGSLSAQADVWESPQYKTYVVQAITNIMNPKSGPDLLFRFKGEAEHSICDTDVRFQIELVQLESRGNERLYFMRPNTVAFGDSGKCKPGEPILTIAIGKKIKSNWYRIKAGSTRTIIVPSWISIESKFVRK